MYRIPATALLIACFIFALASCNGGWDYQKKRDAEAKKANEKTNVLIAEHRDSLAAKFKSINDILTAAPNHPNVIISENDPLFDSLQIGYILGMMNSSGTICKGLTPKNTLALEVESWQEGNAFQDDGPYHYINKKLEQPSFPYPPDLADKVDTAIFEMLGLQYIAVEDAWTIERPKVDAYTKTIKPGMIFKKISVYSLNDKKPVNSFFLAKELSISPIMIVDNDTATPEAGMFYRLQRAFAKKRDTLLYGWTTTP